MPVRAATPLTYEDDAGDALDTRASMDIVSITYDIRQVNRGGPPSLYIEMVLSAPPESQLATYAAEGDAGPCFIDASYRPGTVLSQTLGLPAADFFIGCDGADSALVPSTTRIKDNVIAWSIAMDSIPKEAREAGSMINLFAFTHTSEPVTGIFGNGDQDTGGPGILPTDSAETDQAFNFA